MFNEMPTQIRNKPKMETTKTVQKMSGSGNNTKLTP